MFYDVILKKQFMQHEWSLGSTTVLAIYRNAEITTVSEFVLSLNSREEIQQVMNDLLETKHILLAELIQVSNLGVSYSVAINEILRECFTLALNDLLENSDIIPCNYLRQLRPYLKDVELNALRNQHIQLLLCKDIGCTLEQAIGLQHNWIADNQIGTNSVLNELMLEMVQDTANTIAKLFESMTNTNISWKHFLSLLHLVSVAINDNKVEILRLRAIIKETFNEIIKHGQFEKFVQLILTAREICAANKHVLGEYSSWYKVTFGEMSYRLTKENFILVMEMMTKLIPLEESLEYLQIHVKMAISSPPKCMEIVVTYKQLCRAQLMKLENKSECEKNISQELIVIDNE
ncbi:uncharacterized protein LOC129725044 isoform X2 [Wyeomyia smithii]|uniref:uncharacterized protein LOC129725044 isoform X2 n=1 Tax=Wyeomyia smithii TaxID=174621 RepID=UPI002467BC9C|nr:uncharacterized protein LOC129725044 isoform X2 [Wyeomyia smithii]XP_055536414.1 uncharacterized protein LOC129725044 isoform X2 [Wyeomyia smithii]